MTADSFKAGEFELYACPACKRLLCQEDKLLRCRNCSQAYPIREGIPDFIFEELSRSADPELRRMRFIDRMARIYETNLWYPLILNAYGGLHSSSLPQLVSAVAQKVQPIQGKVLDIACGPGTFGRRVASPAKAVFGIDVSMGMLRQGVEYTTKESISNMHFARARVEALPFQDAVFDATLCCGSLHLFTDTVTPLREMARTMKSGTTLVVFTFTAGRAGLLKYPRLREWVRRDQGLHVFELPEMEQYLKVSGFTGFEPKVSGSILTFTARRQPA